MENIARQQERMRVAEANAINNTIKPPPPTDLIIEYKRPPNFAKIAEAFPAITHRRGVFFTYGLVVYNPDRVKLTPALLAHEKVHSRRQGVDDGPDKWWDQYLTDKKFRLNEELLAHQVEYLIETDGAGRQLRRQALSQIASRLSGPIYGRMVSKDNAKKLIVGEWHGSEI